MEQQVPAPWLRRQSASRWIRVIAQRRFLRNVRVACRRSPDDLNFPRPPGVITVGGGREIGRVYPASTCLTFINLLGP